MTPRLSPHDRARLRALCFCDELTLKKYPRVSAASKLRIERAAKDLRIVLPVHTPAASIGNEPKEIADLRHRLAREADAVASLLTLSKRYDLKPATLVAFFDGVASAETVRAVQRAVQASDARAAQP